MAVPKTLMDTYIPRRVSRYFRFDWNYAVKVVRVPTLKWASQIIVTAPILTQVTSFLDFRQTQVILVWSSALMFVIGYAVLLIRMPLFLRENPSFKIYQDRGNAHRWILWQFRHNFEAFVDPNHAIKETLDKGLSFRTNDATPGDGVYRVSPVFPATFAKGLCVLDPVNLNNDLYVPFYLDGHRYVLPIQDSDPDVDKREKELFWITYTELASTRPCSRFFVWSLFAISAVCFAFGLGLILYHIWTAPPDNTPFYV